MMSDSKATLVATATPDPLGMLDMVAYIDGMDPLVEKFGGELRYRGKIDSAIEGTAKFRVLIVMTFESEAKIEALFESPEYQALIPHRDKAFSSIDTLISTEIGSL